MIYYNTNGWKLQSSEFFIEVLLWLLFIAFYLESKILRYIGRVALQDEWNICFSILSIISHELIRIEGRGFIPTLRTIDKEIHLSLYFLYRLLVIKTIFFDDCLSQQQTIINAQVTDLQRSILQDLLSINVMVRHFVSRSFKLVFFFLKTEEVLMSQEISTGEQSVCQGA